MADTIISDGKGNFKILKGGAWVDYKPSGTTAKGGAPKLSVQDNKFLNDLSTEAAAAGETRRIYERAAKDVKTLRTGPYRGTLMQMATPEEGGGFLDRLGAVLIGGPARLTGAITPQETEAYQRLRGLQSQNVLQAQLAQKGPQTESDAARLMLTEISPAKGQAVNEDIIRQGSKKADRVRARAIFMKQFANRWGSINALSPHGYTADQLWAAAGDRITDSLFGPNGAAQQSARGGSDIRVISRRKK